MSKLLLIIALIGAALLFQPRPGGAVNLTIPTVSVSRNWSGYIVSDGQYTSISGSWVVPKVSGNSSSDAVWVGIGGTTSTDLIQAGTEDIIDPSGNVETGVFYEMLPKSATLAPLKVKAGDSVSVSLSQISEDFWKITFSNNTTGKSYQTNVTYNSTLSSAEWVVEAPSTGKYQIPLDNFKAVTISNASVVKDNEQKSITDINPIPTYMIVGGRPTVNVSQVKNDSFTITRI